MIGFLVPLIVFIVVIAIPSETEVEKNKIVNYWVVARIIFLIICILGMIYNFIPLFIFWKKIIIPNRVDSSSDKRQKEVKEGIKEAKQSIEEKLKQIKENKETIHNNNNNIKIVEVDHDNKVINNKSNLNELANNNTNNNTDPKSKFYSFKRKIRDNIIRDNNL